MRTKLFGVAVVMLLAGEVANAQVFGNQIPGNPVPGSPMIGAAPGRAPTRAAVENYQRFCSACHGPGGRPVMPDVPVLAFNQSLMTQPDIQLLNQLKSGSAKKPPFMGILSDRELLDLVAYIRTFR